MVLRTGLIAATATALVAGAAPVGFAQGTAVPAPARGAAHTAAKAVSAADALVPAQRGKYVQVGPRRVLDTRGPVGVPAKGPLGMGGVAKVALGLPADATAVVLNLTVTGAKSAGFLTVYPDGGAKPTSSNLNFSAGETRAILVTVAVTDGSVDIANHSTSADVVADLEGYYTNDAATAGSSYFPTSPQRLLDTRTGHTPIAAGQSLPVQVTGQAGVPTSGVSAVVLNLTEADATAPGFFTAYADGAPVPAVSNLNFTRGQVVANLAVVPVVADGKIDIRNSAGDADAVADVEGYYSTTPGGSGFTPVAPSRVEDTRSAKAPLVSGKPLAVQVDGTAGVPASGVSAVVVNLTAVDGKASGFLTAYPDGETAPTASSVNYLPTAAVSNLAVVQVGADGKIDIANHGGTADAVLDVFGYFTTPQGAPTNLGILQDGDYRWASGTSAPGPWVTSENTGTAAAPVYLLDLEAQVSTPPVGTTLEAVVTGPNGTQVYDGTNGYGGTGIAIPIDNWVGGAYSWYAVSSYNGVTSPASPPSYFQVDVDTVVTGVTATFTPSTGVSVGTPLTLNMSATSTGTTSGKVISGFCYFVDQNLGPANCTSMIPATDGKASTTLTFSNWGTHYVYVYAETVSGMWGQPATATVYVTG